MTEPIIDAWIQHPTPAFVGHEMFAPLRRWMGLTEIPDAISPELTIGALDAANVSRALRAELTDTGHGRARRPSTERDGAQEAGGAVRG